MSSVGFRPTPDTPVPPLPAPVPRAGLPSPSTTVTPEGSGSGSLPGPGRAVEQPQPRPDAFAGTFDNGHPGIPPSDASAVYLFWYYNRWYGGVIPNDFTSLPPDAARGDAQAFRDELQRLALHVDAATRSPAWLLAPAAVAFAFGLAVYYGGT